MKVKNNRIEKIPLYLIYAVIIIWPLASLPVEIRLKSSEVFLVPNRDGIVTDLALRFREILLLLAGIALVIYWLLSIIFPGRFAKTRLLEKKMRVPFILALAYLALVTISSVFSHHSEISFWGIAGQSEGIAANIGYIALFLASFDYLTEKHLASLINVVSISGGIICLLYIIELISGPVVENLWDAENVGKATQLLFGNAGYCAEYCALILPLLLWGAFVERNKKIKILKSAESGMLISVIISAYSSAAFYAAVLVIVLFFIYVIAEKRTEKKEKIKVAAYAAAGFAVLTLLNFEGIIGAVKGDILNSGVYSSESSFQLTEISMKEKQVYISNKHNSYTIELTDSGSTLVFDKDNNLIGEVPDGKQMAMKTQNLKIGLSKNILYLDLGYSEPLQFTLHNESLVFLAAGGNKVESFDKAAFASLSEYYSFATGRGYIWLNSVPILKNCFIKGVGAGQFAFYYPKYDVVGGLNTHGSAYLLTDKPHSLYLGIAISYGIPALIIFLGIMLIIIKRGTIEGLKNNKPLRSAFLLSVLLFLGMGIVNDSMPSYAMIFWIISGALLNTSQQTMPSKG